MLFHRVQIAFRRRKGPAGRRMVRLRKRGNDARQRAQMKRADMRITRQNNCFSAPCRVQKHRLHARRAAAVKHHRMRRARAFGGKFLRARDRSRWTVQIVRRVKLRRFQPVWIQAPKRGSALPARHMKRRAPGRAPEHIMHRSFQTKRFLSNRPELLAAPAFKSITKKGAPCKCGLAWRRYHLGERNACGITFPMVYWFLLLGYQG